MRVADFNTPAAKLQDALEQLDIAWSHVSDVWQDSARQSFEENCLEPIRPKLKTTLDAITRLSQVVNQAQRALDPSEHITF